jgi:hypothetical protein
MSEISRDNFATRISSMYKLPEVSCFTDSKVFTSNINTGATNFAQVIPFSANIVAVYFTLQASVTYGQNDSLYANFMPVTNYSITNNRGEQQIVKNTSIDGRFYQYLLSRNYFESNLTTSGDSSQFVYCLSFSNDHKDTMQTSAMNGSFAFTQGDSLNITFPTATAPLILTSFVFFENTLTQTMTGPNVVSVC